MIWLDGSHLVHAAVEWASTVEANDGSPCMRMLSSGYIGDKPCDEEKNFICQIDCNTPTHGWPEQNREC